MPGRSASPPPLLVWNDLQAIARMETERAALQDRIARLRPNSHRRVVLTAQLVELTKRQLALETELRKGHGASH
ncbi:hypothetical protein GGR16_003246 [Chelatococcus caeni]|uniref:Uncharacterized protein n=1 Tax=Chelatococcus caeni TaxID=1348468 RepID=A0A840C2L1_9HYPH|nr:hypothetical protein [Chelatococcus caeni]MBB4018212.1 hypothetical protein [Chelatococcus caeni]